MQNLNYQKLTSKLGKKYAKKFPLRIIFELTYNCNHKCKYCYISSKGKKKELTTHQIFSILDKLYDIGTLYITFTGGEIFTRDDIFDILFYAKKKGFIITLYTNGSLIDENIADRIKALSPAKVDITLHGATKNTFDEIAGTQGSYEKVYKGISLLKSRNIRIGLKTTILKSNLVELDQMIRFSKNLGVNLRYTSYITPKNDGCKSTLDYRVEPKKVENLLQKLHPEFSKNNTSKNQKKDYGNENKNELFNCGAGKNNAAISPSGELKLCIEISYPEYDILNGELREGWIKIVGFVATAKPTSEYKCNECSLKKYCTWCPAWGIFEKGKIDACNKYHREYAEVIARLKNDTEALEKAKIFFKQNGSY